MYQRIIRKYYLLSFLLSAGGIQVISAIYVTFLLKNGLSLLDTNLVNAVYFLTLFICEIPTGAFADTFGRKTSVITACLLMSVGLFVYGLSHTFMGFMTAEVILAVGMTFRSGAFKAWLVDSLKHQGYTGSYSKIFSNENLMNRIGGGGGAILGAYLSTKNPALPWFLGGSMMIVVATLAYIIMHEEYFVREIFSWKKGFSSMQTVALSSIRYGSENRAVRFVLIITFIEIYAVSALNMYWQPLFRNRGLGEGYLGVLFTGMTSLLALGALIASRTKADGKERKIILLSMVYVGTFVILSTLSSWLSTTILFFVLHEIGRGFWEPMSDSYLHQRIPSKERATISSFCSIAPHIGGAIGLVISGLIAQYSSISVSWIVAGSVLIFGAFLLRKNGYQPIT